MQLGESIANTIATALLIGFLGVVFALFGKPLNPETKWRIVTILPIDSTTTASVKGVAFPRLPERFDIRLASSRPLAAEQ